MLKFQGCPLLICVINFKHYTFEESSAQTSVREKKVGGTDFKEILFMYMLSLKL